MTKNSGRLLPEVSERVEVINSYRIVPSAGISGGMPIYALGCLQWYKRWRPLTDNHQDTHGVNGLLCIVTYPLLWLT
ncbi:MAG: hypothetical protein ABW152_20420 [Candidatus Thiodiazotropha endolucinida]